MKSKLWLIKFFLFSIMVFVLILGINLIIDPLKIFHKPFVLKDNFNKNMRLQAAGIINNYEFDSIILGTSMLENTSSKEASAIFKSKFVNISQSGSDFFERDMILNYVLRKKNIKTVIYSLDYSGLVFNRLGHNDFPIDNFNFLYDEKKLNDLKVYFNIDLPKCVIKFDFEDCFGSTLDFDRPNEWFSNESLFIKFGHIDNWFKDHNNDLIKKAYSKILEDMLNRDDFAENLSLLLGKKHMESKLYFDTYLLKHVKNNPNTKFIFIVPPYSIIKNAIDSQYKKLDFYILKENLRYLIAQSNIYENLKIYAWGNMAFTDNLANYKDLVHYHQDYNSKMLYWIREEFGLLTINNIEKYLDDFTNKSLNYDLTEFKDKVKNFLERKE